MQHVIILLYILTYTFCLKGLDMEPGREGGMWLGLSTKQIESNIKLRIGVLLNIAGRKTDEASKDRGSIVRNYLTGNYDAQTYIDKILRNGSYKPHHFVAVELKYIGILYVQINLI